MAVSLRQANSDDIVGITYVQATSWIKNYQSAADGVSEADLRGLNFHDNLAQWQHVLKSPNYRVWVMVDGPNVLAFLAARLDEQAAEIYEQHTLPKYQRQGFGSQLLEAVLPWIGKHPLSLRMPIFTESGLQFYQSRGFNVDVNGVVDFIRLPSGKQIPTIVFKRASADLPRKASKTAPVITKIRAAPKLVKRPSQANQVREVTTPPPAVTKAIGRNELAKLSGVRASTIKYYTEIGILPFVQEDTRLARRYEQKSALSRLDEIANLRGKGFTIKEIRAQLTA